MTCVGSLIALECASHAIKRAKVLKKKIAEFSDKPDHLKIAASKVPCLSLSLSRALLGVADGENASDAFDGVLVMPIRLQPR